MKNDLISKQAAIDALIEWYGCEPSDIYTFENIIEKLPSTHPEITEEDVREWCYKRCLTIIDDALFLEMRSRWSASAQPEITVDRALTEEEIKNIKQKMADLPIVSMPSAQSEPQWIPCSERLPEPVATSQRREWFITSNQYGAVTLTCYEFESSPFKEGWQTDMTILAWMPLPEPWKGEQE